MAIINQPADLAIARERHWYRIPVRSVRRFLKERWPPESVAFYQPKVFESEQYSVRYYARVLDIRKAFRWQLFPEEPVNKKTNRRYYQLMLSPLEERHTDAFWQRLERLVPDYRKRRRWLEEEGALYDL